MRLKTLNWWRFIEESSRAAWIVHDAQFAQYLSQSDIKQSDIR